MKLKISQKITGLLVFYFLVAVVAIGSTLYVSWQLEGSAAAINDAGKERMRSYRIAFLLAQQVRQPELNLWTNIEQETRRFERTLMTSQISTISRIAGAMMSISQAEACPMSPPFLPEPAGHSSLYSSNGAIGFLD